MDRRKFLSMIGGVVAASAVRTFPFRVYSFPKNIILPFAVDNIQFYAHYDAAGRLCPVWTVSASINERQRFFRTTKEPYSQVQAMIIDNDLSGLEEIAAPYSRPRPGMLVLAAEEQNRLLL